MEWQGDGGMRSAGGDGKVELELEPSGVMVRWRWDGDGWYGPADGNGGGPWRGVRGLEASSSEQRSGGWK